MSENKLYKRVEINKEGNTDIPVSCVCYHPIAEKRLRDGEDVEPNFCIVEYEYDSILDELCQALGWQGGTIHQVIEKMKKLNAVSPEVPAEEIAKAIQTECLIHDDFIKAVHQCNDIAEVLSKEFRFTRRK